MTTKTLILSLLLLIESVALGVLLGLLDFFGFLGGEHTFNLVYLGLSFLNWHALGLTIFLLNLADTPQQTIYSVAALAFGAVFFGFNQQILPAVLATLFFFLFLLYTEHKLTTRARLFVKYSTREIVFTVIRRSFLFLLIIFLLLSFFQGSRNFQKKGLITPYIVRSLSKPAVLIINKQLSSQLQTAYATRFQERLGTSERRAIVTFVLNEAIESLDEGTTRQYFGISRANIPLDKTIIYDNGEIDLTPVVNEMAPDIARTINERLLIYLPFLPLLFALIVFALVSPLMSLSELVLLPVVRLLIALMLKLRVISVAQEKVERETLKL